MLLWCVRLSGLESTTFRDKLSKQYDKKELNEGAHICEDGLRQEQKATWVENIQR